MAGVFLTLPGVRTSLVKDLLAFFKTSYLDVYFLPQYFPNLIFKFRIPVLVVEPLNLASTSHQLMYLHISFIVDIFGKLQVLQYILELLGLVSTE